LFERIRHLHADVANQHVQDRIQLGELGQRLSRKKVPLVVGLDPDHQRIGFACCLDQLHDALGERGVGAHVAAEFVVEVAAVGTEVVLHVDDDDGGMSRVDLLGQ